MISRKRRFFQFYRPAALDNGFNNPAPAQALSSNMGNLVFADDFVTTTYTVTKGSTWVGGINWYPAGFGGWTTGTSTAALNTGAGSGALAGGKGIFTVGMKGEMNTVPTFPPTQTTTPIVFKGSWRHFYVEARIQVDFFNPNPDYTTGWPSFWSFGTSAFTGLATGNTAELDFNEWFPNGPGTNISLISTGHNWAHAAGQVTGSDLSNTQGNNFEASPISDSGWHIWGCKWAALTPTTGYFEFYRDNVLMTFNNSVTRFLTGVGTGTGSGSVTNVSGTICYTPKLAGLSQIELDYMYLILGSGVNWAVNVDWVRLWQDFDPSQVANLGMWYDMQDASTITQSSGNVSQLTDKSGNNITLASGSSTPTVAATGINGLPCLAFNGTNQNLVNTNVTHNLAAGMTMFVVMKPVTTQTNRYLIELATPVTTPTANDFTIRNSVASESLRPVASNFFGGNMTTATNTPYVSYVTCDGAGGYEMFINGVSNGGNGGFPAMANSGYLTVGSKYDNTLFWSGNIGEILVYNRKLTTTEQTNISNYLKAKWGISY